MVQTQKDHVDAHAFLVGRMTSALVLGEASHLDTPARRAWRGLIIGLVLAVLIFAGFFVYGLIANRDEGSGSPRTVRPPSHVVRMSS